MSIKSSISADRKTTDAILTLSLTTEMQIMEEGCYWIQFEGKVQIARYFNQVAEDFETSEMVTGGWDLFGQNTGIIHTNKVEILSARLQPPAK